MTGSFFLSLIAFAGVLLIVTVGIRIGAALAKITDFGLKKSLVLAAILLVVELACIAAMTLGTSEFREPLSAVFGLGGLVLGIVIPLGVVKLQLKQSWGKAIVVWLTHAVAAVFGFAAAGAIMSPGVIDAQEKAALARTISDIKNSGIAVEDWMAGQVLPETASAAPDQVPISLDLDVRHFTAIPCTDLRELIGETGENPYRDHFPEEDGWGHPIEYLLERDDLDRVIRVCIRSPGRDGRYDGDVYERGPFAKDDYDQDVVWTNSGLLRWPE